MNRPKKTDSLMQTGRKPVPYSLIFIGKLIQALSCGVGKLHQFNEDVAGATGGAAFDGVASSTMDGAIRTAHQNVTASDGLTALDQACLASIGAFNNATTLAVTDVQACAYTQQRWFLGLGKYAQKMVTKFYIYKNI